MEHRPADGEALHQAPREQAHGLIGPPPHPDGFEQLLDPLGPHAVEPGVVAEVLATAQIAVQQRVVGQQSEPRPHREPPPRQRLPEHEHLARVWPEQRREDPQQRRLARAVSPEDRQGGSRGHLQRQIPEHRPLTEVAVEAP